MLRPATYIVVDCETTGLDTTHDEPIQIGLVQFDHTFTIIATYSSYIRPSKPEEDLAEIVQSITGITKEQLLAAPSKEAVADALAPFFEQPRIMIGHNVAFDLAMLNKIVPVTPQDCIDTFPLAKTVFHFLPSYALDVIHTHIPADFTKSTTAKNYHDALTDCYATFDLFHYALQQITFVRRKYRVIDALIQKSNTWFNTYLTRTQKNFSYDEKQLFLPPLKKAQKTPKKTHADTITLPWATWNMHSIAHLRLKEIISKVDHTNKRLILAFDMYPKVQIAQAICQQLYKPATTEVSTRIFDEERVNFLLQKSHPTYDEILFVSKYFLQFERQDTHVDGNWSEFTRIYHALTRVEVSSPSTVLLCTHHTLFGIAPHLDAQDIVLFFDADRWIESVQSWMYTWQYPDRLLGILDDLLYYYSLWPYEKIYQQLKGRSESYAIFLAALYQETEQFFTSLQWTQELDSFVDNPRCPKVRWLIGRLTTSMTDFLTQLLPEHAQTLATQWDAIRALLEHPCTVQVHQQRTGNSFAYRPKDSFVAWEDLQAIASHGAWYFLSTKTHAPVLRDSAPLASSHAIRIETIPQPNTLLASITPQHTYILSVSKDASTKLYKSAVTKWIHKTHTLIAENITWGNGKNLFVIEKSTQPCVIIGGYKFLYALLAKKVALSRIIIYYLAGPMNEQMVRDLYWYLEK
jgi:DNA polymerase III epsilon subunit-like protein